VTDLASRYSASVSCGAWGATADTFAHWPGHPYQRPRRDNRIVSVSGAVTWATGTGFEPLSARRIQVLGLLRTADGVDQAHMAECLGEVAEEFAGLRIDLFRNKPQIIPIA
jgi:hypothetical protein